MSEAIKRRRGTTLEHSSFTGLEGEITVDMTKKTAVIHDGTTPGGFPLARADEVNLASGKSVRVDTTQSFSAEEKGRAVANIGANVLSGFRDKIINGDGQINQRTYTTVADDQYWCDRHYVLTQTAAITPSVIADVEDGTPFMMRLTQSQATAQRMGNAQIIESSTSKRLRGKKVTLGGKIRYSVSGTVRVAILQWTGAANQVTSDVVADWGNSTLAPGGFFISTGLSVVAIGEILPQANTMTDWSLTADVESSCNNLIVMCWTAGAPAQGSTLDLVWGLVEGDASAERWPYASRGEQQELALCQRYAEAVDYVIFSGMVTSGSLYYVFSPFKVTKRAAPNSSNIAITMGSVSGFDASAPAMGVLTPSGVRFNKTATSTVNAGFYIITYFVDVDL